MKLHRRIQNLELVHSEAAPSACPDCGRIAGRLPEGSEITMQAVFGDHDGPDVCHRCGARLVLRLEFDHPFDYAP